jgi:uncharacterized protein YndB with AHSA1/START domain
MGMLTSGRVEITAPAADVWAWLVDPVKVTAWLGGAGGLPEDPAELHVGWSSTSETAAGTVKVEVTEFDPPTRLGYRQTYVGGDSISTYTLTEVGGKTTLTLEGDTDWARPKGGFDAAIEQALEGQPADMVALAEQKMHEVEQQLEQGAYDASAQPLMQASVEASLTKLKSLVEAAAGSAKN